MLATALLPLVMLVAAADDEAFRTQVRPTEPLTPRQQQPTFHVPPGFEVQLFAAEPELQKPMNLAFDAAGRLWVSGSVEYPYLAADGAGKDAIKVLEDTDGDGQADKVTTFVDGLNIPIGLYPYRDGVIAYSAPNIWFFRDTDGDGRADERQVLYGPIGTPRDTHGMQNAFRRGFDGWLYINHGFANDTTISARDGSSIQLQSGNTYRVRLDGSRVEQMTWGQVNPFGSDWLPTGDLITADCHSRPLTQLLRGAYYPSFGKPHDGLGFAPDLMEHSHGSTAISGVACVTGDNFPESYQGRLFVGNVMTSRVNQDRLQYTGATPRAIEQPDFLSTDDPWFRPVDLRFGPDGALYIADFYNRIIGHYEVPLDHPGRDRHRGRIWRVVYRGEDRQRSLPVAPNLATADVDQLIQSLAHPSLTRRMLATDELTDRLGVAAAPKLAAALSESDQETVRVHALWCLFRLGQLDAAALQRAVRDSSELVRVHALRVMSEMKDARVDLAALRDPAATPTIRRVAADAVAQGAGYDLRELIGILADVPAEDQLQRHAWRLAVRNQLRQPEAWEPLRAQSLRPDEITELVSIAVAVPSPESAAFLLDQLRKDYVSQQRLEPVLSHLCTHLPAERLTAVVELIRDKSAAEPELQLRLMMLVYQRVRQRGGDVQLLRPWALQLADQLIRGDDRASTHWQRRSGGNPWGLEPRRSADGQNDILFLSSLPGGERQQSVLRSATFTVPPQLEFYICGHLGFPNEEPSERNFIQLRLADDGKTIAKALPPRNDTAQRVKWDLSQYAGQQGYLELVDGLDLTAYAWLAVARFDPPVVSLPRISPSKQTELLAAGLSLVGTLQLAEFQADAERCLSDRGEEWSVRAAAAQAKLSFTPQPLLAAMAPLISEASLDTALRTAICEQMAAAQIDPEHKLLSDLMRAAPARVQRQLSESLASSATGAQSLLTLVELGHAAPQLLQDIVVKQKIDALRVPAVNERLEKLTAGLPPANVAVQRLIDERRRSLLQGTADRGRGEQLFRKHCAACHQVAGQGTLIGPQLDGIASRGAERLIEDVLDPNRNVDATFHVTVLALTNGQVVNGLLRREEGGGLILANQEGKEFMVLKSDIEDQTKTLTSLMPANFGELLPSDEFRDLIAYLLQLTKK